MSRNQPAMLMTPASANDDAAAWSAPRGDRVPTRTGYAEKDSANSRSVSCGYRYYAATNQRPCTSMHTQAHNTMTC